MKEITCIQQYVIDNLINDKRLSIENLIEAVIKTCSTEQFNNILSILIRTPIPCTNKENSEDNTKFVKMCIFIPKEASKETKIQIIKVLREQFDIVALNLREARDYVDSCIGKYSILPKVVRQEEVDKIAKKLEPYNVNIFTIKIY